MDSDHIVQSWNAAIDLRAPVLSSLKTLTRADRCQRVFTGVDEIVALSDTTFVKLRIGSTLEDCARVQSFGIVMDERYFVDAAVSFKRPSHWLTLFESLPLRGSAQEVLDAINTQFPAPLKLVTAQRGYTIVYGATVFLEFLCTEDAVRSPTASYVAALSFNFGPEYSGALRPTLKVGSARLQVV